MKPSNILLDTQGNPHVCDFGLAVDEEVQRLRRGEVAGTLPYMAPEQVRGETTSPRRPHRHLGPGRHPLSRSDRHGCRFAGTARPSSFDEILHREPKPPRQMVDPASPASWNGSACAALSRPMTERYLTAADLAEESAELVGPAPAENPSRRQVPSRLSRRASGRSTSRTPRSFSPCCPAHGEATGCPSRSGSGRPGSRRWKGDKAFSVGLLYGPSGGGKIVVRQGRAPAEPGPRAASARSTSRRPRTGPRPAARRAAPGRPVAPAAKFDLPDGDRDRCGRHRAIRPREKLLLVFDQFEQWLQGRPVGPEAELVRALRQCDGRRVQALLLVRDDFWMAITRFLRAVEVPLVEGTNAAAVELFDARHARKVLGAVRPVAGPASAHDKCEPGGEASLFLDRRSHGLAGPDGRVIPVRLSLFAEVVRHRPWTRDDPPHTWEASTGIGVEVPRGGASSPPRRRPAWRVHRSAAEAVLNALLPPPASVIRGRPRPESIPARGGGLHRPPRRLRRAHTSTRS